MDKQSLFIDWLCGKTDTFPFFKDMPEVKTPKAFSEPERSYCRRCGADLRGYEGASVCGHCCGEEDGCHSEDTERHLYHFPEY